MVRRILCTLTLLLLSSAILIGTIAPQQAYAVSDAGAASTAVSRLLADRNGTTFKIGDGEKCPLINEGGNCWWWAANAWMALISYAEENPNSADASKITNDLSLSYFGICADYRAYKMWGKCPTAPNQSGRDPFTINTHGNTYFDDIGWWDQMWINAYKFTKVPDYLYLAEELWNYVTTNGFKANGCGGIVQHHDQGGSSGGSAADAFANSLYLRNSAWLYSVTGEARYMRDSSNHGRGAIAEADWIRQHLIFKYAGPALGNRGSQFMIADHLTNCKAAGNLSALQTQGEMVNAWTDMYAACKKLGSCPAKPSYYNNLADELALTVIHDNPARNATYPKSEGQHEPTVDSRGILSEPCFPTGKNKWPYGCALGSSLGKPGTTPFKPYLISKGIFERAIYCSNHNFNDSALTSFAAKNAASIASLPHFGFIWDSTAANAPVIFPTQASVLDGLDAHLGGSYAMC